MQIKTKSIVNIFAIMFSNFRHVHAGMELRVY